MLHVVPGTDGAPGSGTGTAADPFRGLKAAQAAARPGCLLLLAPWRLRGHVRRSIAAAQPGRPIIWRGAGDGETVIDGQGRAARRPERAIAASDAHDVWFEDLTIRRATWGLVAHMSQRLVVRRCHFHDVKRGITATRNTDGRLGGLFIADNLLEGPFAWTDRPHGAKVEENRGIEVGGAGNVICYNRVRGFKDGIDMYPSVRCVACDVHNNEVSECLDDGCEMDGSERNCRCYLNRFTNVFQGISVQPVYGGPIYIFRNALYNLERGDVQDAQQPFGGVVPAQHVGKEGQAADAFHVRAGAQLGVSQQSVHRHRGPRLRLRSADDRLRFRLRRLRRVFGPHLPEVEQRPLPVVGGSEGQGARLSPCRGVDPATVFAAGISRPPIRSKQYDPREH